MNLKNCPRCGKLFSDDGVHKICPACRQEEEENFNKVKEYLWDNPNSTIDRVSEETGVNRKTIVKFVREERLLSEGLTIAGGVTCERCGALITHGRFCEKCRDELVGGFSKESKDREKKNQRKTGEMFLKNRIEKRKE